MRPEASRAMKSDIAKMGTAFGVETQAHRPVRNTPREMTSQTTSASRRATYVGDYTHPLHFHRMAH